MRRPECPQHPGSRVWRDGRYGKNGQYQRWRCVPPGCKGDSPECHFFQIELPRKALGGARGACTECEREWGPGEGLPSARTDRFSLREKAEALVDLARGSTYRQAARRARRKALARGAEISADGRIAGDWVSMYAPILHEQLLTDHPQYREWPQVLVLDAAPFHGRTTYPNGRPKPSGRLLFSVLGALSYGMGTVDDAHRGPRGGSATRVWQWRAYRHAGTAAWLDFFSQLDGKPLYVICDGAPHLLRAIEQRWKDMPVFRCTAHLTMQAREYVRQAGLRETPFGQSIDERTFTSRRRWEWFQLGLENLEEDGLTENLSRSQEVSLQRLRTWTSETADAIDFNLDNEHAPWSTGGIERPLRVVKNSLYDRRFALRNLDRLTHLLALMQLAQLQFDDAHAWAHSFHDQHLAYAGHPPPRRLVDKHELWPGPRGGRRPAPQY